MLLGLKYGSRGVKCTAARLLKVLTGPTRSVFVMTLGVVLEVDFGVCAAVFVGIRSISRPKVTGFVAVFEV